MREQDLSASLSAQPHELVLEQSIGREGRLPTFRGGIIRDDAVVDPVAKALAAQADVVVVAVGFDSEIELESADREFALPPGQERLIRELAKVNPRVVVVLTSGGSVDVSGWRDSVPALIAAWYPGQEGGAALADVLLGKASPSGRLPVFPTPTKRVPRDDRNASPRPIGHALRGRRGKTAAWRAARRVRELGHLFCSAACGTGSVAPQLSASNSTTSSWRMSSRSFAFRPSPSMVMQMGQALAMVVAPVSMSCSVRLTARRARRRGCARGSSCRRSRRAPRRSWSLSRRRCPGPKASRRVASALPGRKSGSSLPGMRIPHFSRARTVA
jgi:hypothetical protein